MYLRILASNCKSMDQAPQHLHAKIAHFRSKAGILEIDKLRATRLDYCFLVGAARRATWIWNVDPLRSIALLD